MSAALEERPGGLEEQPRLARGFEEHPVAGDLRRKQDGVLIFPQGRQAAPQVKLQAKRSSNAAKWSAHIVKPKAKRSSQGDLQCVERKKKS